jgi:hypothetical protein
MSYKTLIKHIILKTAEKDFVRRAIAEQADLSSFKEKPSFLVISGIFVICLSFVLGWPAVAALGALAVKLDKPMIAVIGGPLTYGLSHLVFLFGMYLSGGKYTLIFFRWLTRVTMEKLLTTFFVGKSVS